MLNFKHLKYFWTVGKAGGVIKAGEQLHVTPQTVSAQIQLLESALGVTLLERSGRTLALTEAGRLVFGYAEEIFSLGSELQDAVDLLEKGGRLSDFKVFVADAVPHSWLFPRMAAVVHHGGAGTTAEGLRAGVPTVIVPFIFDQPFWGARVKVQGLGPTPIPRKRLTVDALAQAIDTAVSDAGMRQRAQACGHAIRAEDGVGNAVRIVTQYLGAP